MYQTKSRSDIFEQPLFTTTKHPKDTFWEDENVRPFHLSIPEQFQHKKAQATQKNTRNASIKRSTRPNTEDAYYKNQQRFANRQQTPYMYDRPYSTLYGFFVQNFYANWIEKELNFTMSKLSVLALIIGLFFLSSLLFITGFLIAVNVYNIGAPQEITSNLQSGNYTLPNLDGSMPQMGMPQIGTQQMTGTLANTPLANTPRSDLMKANPTDLQNARMGDVTMQQTERLPSKYAQLPVQSMPPMPESGAQYMVDQRAPLTDHLPSPRPVYAQQPAYPSYGQPAYAPPYHPNYAPQQYQQPYQQQFAQRNPNPAQAQQNPYIRQQVPYRPQPMPPAPYPGGYPQAQYQQYPQQQPVAPGGYAPAPY